MEVPSIPRNIPLLVVISGPSGVGKSSLCERLFAEDYSLEHSVSATTRPPRDGEVEGQDYYFLAKADFERGIKEGRFLEWAEVHGNLYGTLKSEVQDRMAAGKTPVLNIDVQGGKSIKDLEPNAVLIFLMPPSLEVLEHRLRGRGTNSEDDLEFRLGNSKAELAMWSHYDYVVVNDDLAEAVARTRHIISSERARSRRIISNDK